MQLGLKAQRVASVAKGAAWVPSPPRGLVHPLAWSAGTTGRGIAVASHQSACSVRPDLSRHLASAQRAGFLGLGGNLVTNEAKTTATRPGILSRSSRVAYSSSAMAEEDEAEIYEKEEVEVDRRPLVFVHNSARAPFPYETAEDFLLMGKRGAYTTARSVDGSAVFEFEAHVERLIKSVRLMMEAGSGEGSGEGKGEEGECLRKHSDLLSCEALRPKLMDSIGKGMRQFKEENSELASAREMKITLLVTWDRESFDISTLIVPLGERPQQPVKVQVGGKPRRNALAKDSEWTRQRRALELAKPADCNEVILCDEGGRLFEGLQTNFYAVVDGRVQTAGEGILEGTVRKMLLDACEKGALDVPLDLQPPSVREMDKWQGAFISSTSRLLLPISEIIYTDASGQQQRKSFAPLDPLVQKLESFILDKYREESTVIV